MSTEHTESRTKKTLLNARINTICYFASLITAFFTRKILLDKLGADFIGLTGAMSSLLGFLNLAELGISSAIAYNLYKPLFDKNREKINEIVSVLGYLYRCIGLFILGAGIILSLFLPLIFADTIFSFKVIFFGYYAFLSTSLIGYFANYKAVLLSADQRNYIVTGYFQLTTSIRVVLQMLLAIYFQSFYLYLSIELIFGGINSLILNHKIKKTYPWLDSEVRLGKELFKKYPTIITQIKQIFAHKVGEFVQNQISPLLIYSYVSLTTVALYGNYTLITQRMQGLIGGILNSAAAGIGNLISSGKKEKVYKIYKEIFSIRFLSSGIFASCFYYLSTPFIEIWLGNEYPLADTIVFLISFNVFLSMHAGVYHQFLYGFGLFNDTWAPLAESAIFIIASITFGTNWGLAGVLCGPITSLLIIVHIWKPIFLYKKGLKEPFYKHLFMICTHTATILVAYFIAQKTTEIFKVHADLSQYNIWLIWIITSIVFTTIITIVAFCILYLLSPDLRSFISRFIKNKKYANSISS